MAKHYGVMLKWVVPIRRHLHSLNDIPHVRQHKEFLFVSTLYRQMVKHYAVMLKWVVPLRRHLHSLNDIAHVRQHRVSVCFNAVQTDGQTL